MEKVLPVLVVSFWKYSENSKKAEKLKALRINY